MSEPGAVFYLGVRPSKPHRHFFKFVRKILEMRYFGLNLTKKRINIQEKWRKL